MSAPAIPRPRTISREDGQPRLRSRGEFAREDTEGYLAFLNIEIRGGACSGKMFF